MAHWYQLSGIYKPDDRMQYIGMYDRKAEAIRDGKAMIKAAASGAPWSKVVVYRFTNAYDQGELIFEKTKEKP